MVSRLSLRLLCTAVLVGASALHAQTAPASPSWAKPINDATGQQMVATPVTPDTPPLHPRPTSGRVAVYTSAATMPMHTTYSAVVAPASARDAGTYVIPAGMLLSRGLSDYVMRYGWSLRWLVRQDYRLDAPLPIPAGSVSAGVTFVVHAYQVQGGLLGDVPRFANPNKVVVIQPVTTAKELN